MAGKWVLACALIMAVIPGAAAQVYKCTDPDGKVVYQQKACEAGKREAAVRIEEPGPTDLGRHDAVSGLDQGVAMILLAKLLCDDAVPGYRERTARDYAAWRAKHYASVVKMENNPGFRGTIDRMRKQNMANPPEAVARMKEECEGYGDRLVEEALGPDPRFASPEKAWETWIASLRGGDREGAKRCLTDTAANKFAPLLNQATPDQLKAMADAIGTFKITVGTGDVREGFATRKDGRAGFVYFTSVGEQWKISEM
jgi:hypothetical protein